MDAYNADDFYKGNELPIINFLWQLVEVHDPEAKGKDQATWVRMELKREKDSKQSKKEPTRRENSDITLPLTVTPTLTLTLNSSLSSPLVERERYRHHRRNPP